jgi:MFS family permease
MFATYRRVLGLPGALVFSLSGLVARLPISMVSLGIVLLVSARTGSYGYAGGVSAAYIAAQAIGAVPIARLLDRFGQSRILGPAVSVSATGLVLLIVAVEADWGTPVPHLFAVLAGVTMPNVGAAVRARWSHAVPDRSVLDTAFAVEAVNDELVFIVGPTLVTLLAAGVHPQAGLLTAAVAALVGTWGLAAQRRTEPPRHQSVGGPVARDPMPWLSLAPLVLGALTLGVLFGGAEVAVVAFTDERGGTGSAGVLLAVWALGSLLAGLVAGTMAFKRSAAARYRIGTVCLASLMLPMPFLDSTVLLGVFFFLGGFAISPTMIAAVSWVEGIVPRTRLNEGMTVVTTGLTAGVAPGAALVGVVVDHAGAAASFWVPAGAGAAAAVVALVSRPRTKPAPTSPAAVTDPLSGASR